MLRGLASMLSVVAAAAVANVATPAPPTLARACGSTSGLDGAQTFWLTTADRVRLYAMEAGRGSTTIVLAHEGRSNLCDTLPYGATLVAAGFRVLAFDFRGHGWSEAPTRNGLALGNDLAAAVQRSRGDGARHVFLAGASMGGAAVVQDTAGLGVDGRISFSGTRLWPGFGINHDADLATIRAPFLYVGTRDDWRAPLKEALRIFRSVGAHDKRTAFYPGSWHGWDLVTIAPFARRTRTLVLAWIRSRS
jgi:dienelactone hydrolase